MRSWVIPFCESFSASRTVSPFSEIILATETLVESSAMERMAFACPVVSFPVRRRSTTSSGRLNRRNAFAMAGRDRPTRFAICSCVQPVALARLRYPSASSMGFKSSRCRFQQARCSSRQSRTFHGCLRELMSVRQVLLPSNGVLRLRSDIHH